MLIIQSLVSKEYKRLAGKMPAPQRFDDLFVYETEILHQGKKPGLLAIAKAENLDFSLRNQVSEVLLRMVQDLSEMKKCYI